MNGYPVGMGLVLTSWALAGSNPNSRTVANNNVMFLILLYLQDKWVFV